MPDKKLTDFFTLNNIDLDKAYKIARCTRSAGKLFFFEQLCIKLREENRRQQAENKRLTIRLRKAEHQLDDLCKMHNIIKAEAYKEFAKVLENKLLRYRLTEVGVEVLQMIHDTLKELVGDTQ